MPLRMPCLALSAPTLPQFPPILPPPISPLLFSTSLPWVLTSPPGLSFSLPAHSSSPRYPAPPSLLFLCLFSDPSSSAMCPGVLLCLWFPLLYVISCSSLSVVSLILVLVLPGGSTPRGLCDRPCQGYWSLDKVLSLRCQQSKIQSHVKSPVPRIPVPDRRFTHVHLDLV